MKYLIVAIEAPEHTGPDKQYTPERSYSTMLQSIQDCAAPTTDTVTLGRGVWLLPLTKAAPLLSAVFAASSETGAKFRVLVLDEAPEALVVP